MRVTVIALLPLVALLFLTFAYTCAAGVPSLFQPKTAGDIRKVDDPLDVVLISVSTPEPGKGSVPSDLLLSEDLDAESTYKTTYAGALIAIFNNEKDLPAVGIVIFADELREIDPVLAFVVVLEPSDVPPPPDATKSIVPSES